MALNIAISHSITLYNNKSLCNNIQSNQIKFNEI